MVSLIRTRAAGFDINDAITLNQCEELMKESKIEEKILPLDKVFEQYESFVVKDNLEKKVRNGNSFYIKKPDGRYRVYLSGGEFAAVYDIENGISKICGYFLT